MCVTTQLAAEHFKQLEGAMDVESMAAALAAAQAAGYSPLLAAMERQVKMHNIRQLRKLNCSKFRRSDR